MTDGATVSGLAGTLASGLVTTALSRLPVSLPGVTGTGAAAAPPAPAKLTKAAHDFEAIFMRQMLAAADKADFGNSLFTGDGIATFRSMQEARFADVAAGRGTLGIAKMLEHRLAAHAGAAGAPAATTPAAGS